MAAYIALPGYKYPKNALLDFSPVSSALTDYSKGLDQAYDADTARQIGAKAASGDYKGAAESAFQRGNLDAGIKVNEYGQKQEDRIVQKASDMALAIALEPDLEKRKPALISLNSLNPNKNLDPIYYDPEFGPLKILADANRIGDYYNLKFKSSAEARAQDLHGPQKSLLQAQANAASQKNSLDTAIAGLFRRATEEQGSATSTPASAQVGSTAGQPSPSLQGGSSVSSPGGIGSPGILSGVPGISVSPPPPAPNQASALPQPGTPTPSAPPGYIDTPLGRMTVERAKQLSFALGLAGKGEAGKMLLDAENGPFKSAKELASTEAEMRKEFLAQAKNFQIVRDAHRQISNIAAEPPTAAGDISLIYSYMKLLDPTSVVRESEYATAQNATGVPSQIINLYNRVRAGERLNPSQRADFANTGKLIYATQLAGYNQTRNQYRTISQRIGLNPDNIIVEQEIPEAGPPVRLGTDPGEYNRLPAGTRFVDPDGNVRVKR